MTDTRGRMLGVWRLDFLDWRQATRSFSQLAVLTGSSLNVSEQGRPAEQYQRDVRLCESVRAAWSAAATGA